MKQYRPLSPILLTLLLALLLSLCACAPNDGFNAGQPITKEELESLAASLLTEEGSSPESSPGYSDREPNTYYWTPNGKVHHPYRDCVHLKNAREVESGSLISARGNGRETPCSECFGD